MATQVTTLGDDEPDKWTISIPLGRVDEPDEDAARLIAMLRSMLLGEDSLDDGEEDD